MSEKKKYTFEDWETGEIYRDLMDENFSRFVLDQVTDIGHLYNLLYSDGYLDYKTFLLIQEAQKETFYKLSDHNAEASFRSFKNQYANAPFKKEYLLHTKEALDKLIQSYPKSVTRPFYAGEWSPTGIGYDRYMIINDTRALSFEGSIPSYDISPNKTYIDKDNKSFTVRTGSKYNNTNNPLFDFRVSFEFRELVKSFAIQEGIIEVNIGKEKSSNSSLTLDEIVEQFIKGTKTSNTPYGKREYRHVMWVASQNPEVNIYKELVDIARTHKDAPKKLKDRKKSKDYKTEMRWIKFYDKQAGITRK